MMHGQKNIKLLIHGMYVCMFLCIACFRHKNVNSNWQNVVDWIDLYLLHILTALSSDTEVVLVGRHASVGGSSEVRVWWCHRYAEDASSDHPIPPYTLY